MRFSPQNLEAEKAVLGSALIDSVAAKITLALLSAEAFYSQTHRLVFSAIKSLVDSKSPVDIVSVADALRVSGHLVEVGSGPALKAMQDSVATADHVEHYCRIVLKTFYDRELMRLADVIDKANESEHTDVRDRALDEIAKVCRSRDIVSSNSGMTMSEAVHAALDGIDQGPALMVKCGIGDIDDLTGGQEPGDLMTLGARTGVGKTATLLSFAMNMARKGEKVAFCAGEMAGEQVAKRALSSISGIEHYRIRNRRLGHDDIRRILDAGREVSELPIRFCTIPSPSLRDIRAFSDASRSSVVIVDYLTRCELPKSESMRVSVNHFMRGLKNMARETQRVVILAAQISRQTDRNPDQAPTLADLKESSAIEEESDQVILLHMKSDEKAKTVANLDVAVAKNRHGRMGVCSVSFNKAILRVGDIPSESLPFDGKAVSAHNDD